MKCNKTTIRITLALAMLAVGIGIAWADVPSGTRADMFEDSQYAVLVDTFGDREQVRAGDEFALAARITPFQSDEIHFHIYGSEPSEDWSYFPTALIPGEEDGVAWGDPLFPPGEQHDTQMWLPGQPVVTLTGKLDDDFAPGMHTFTADLNVQACTEDMCLMPSAIALSWELEVVAADYAGDIAVLTHDELFAEVDVDYSRFSLPETEDELGGGLTLTDESDETEGVAVGGIDLTTFENDASTSKPIWFYLLMALLGGLILNVMPCVLPVVSIKVIDLVGSTGKEPKEIIGHGLAFAAGIIATFLLGALIIVAIQAFGTQLGWGFQFQDPAFILVMSTIMFVFGLSLIDVFKIKATEGVTTGAGGLAKQEGYSGSFFKGVLATLLGTPCVGPFLGPALIVAFTLTWVHTLAIFFFVGLGMALPYLVMLPFLTRLSRRDRGRLSRKLQGSKDWLNDFKVVMAFLLFATVIYLLSILIGTVGGWAIIWALAFLTGVAFASWLWTRLSGLGKRYIVLAWVSALLVVAFSGWLAIPRVYASAIPENNEMTTNAHEGWETFSIAKLQEHTAAGKTVLVDFTADWCPNCKTNEAVALNISSTKQLKEELGIVFMMADWTARDDEIGDALRALGFASVPLTAIFPGSNPDEPILLDGVFTPSRLHDVMREAADAN